MTQKGKFGDCPVEVLQVQIIDEIVQVPVEKELHPHMTQKEKEEFYDLTILQKEHATWNAETKNQPVGRLTHSCQQLLKPAFV